MAHKVFSLDREMTLPGSVMFAAMSVAFGHTNMRETLNVCQHDLTDDQLDDVFCRFLSAGVEGVSPELLSDEHPWYYDQHDQTVCLDKIGDGAGFVVSVRLGQRGSADEAYLNEIEYDSYLEAAKDFLNRVKY